MRYAAARSLARHCFSSQSDGGAPSVSQLAHAKMNLTLAERVAGSAARSDAEARAAEYVRRRARAQEPAGDQEPFSRPEGALAPLDDGDSRRAYLAEPPPEGGLAGVAELRIKAAQRQGDFDNLRLRGSPLENVLDPHEATHFTAHGGAIAARILKAANYKCALLALAATRLRGCALCSKSFAGVLTCLLPPVPSLRPASLELRAELDEARRVALAELRLAVAAALRGRPGDERGAIAAVCGDARLRRSWEALNATVKAYNNAALADRESFGALWPAQSRRACDLEADAREAVAELQQAVREG